MISLSSKGNFNKTEKLLKKSLGKDWMSVLDKYAQQGVQALASATPIESGVTACAWDYEITQEKGAVSIVWKNYNINKGVNIAIILQYGHATGNGGYVRGRDYINPALRPIFDQLADAAWKEITSL